MKSDDRHALIATALGGPALGDSSAELRYLYALIIQDLTQHGDPKTAARIVRDAFPWSATMDDDDLVAWLGQLAEALTGNLNPRGTDPVAELLQAWRRDADVEAHEAAKVILFGGDRD